MSDEEWRVISGFPAYSVSNHGKVMRTKSGRFKVNYKILGKKGPNGYLSVGLYNNGKHKKCSVHSLVCEEFIGPRPSPNHQCCHNDGKKDNNHVENLRWGTRQENMADCHKHGTARLGDKHHSRINPSCMARGERNGGGGKLKETDVKKILSDNRLHRVIASEYGVVKSMVGMIKRREVWKHVEEDK